MEPVVEAIYANRVFTPLESLDLPERQRVAITIRVLKSEGPDDALEAWQRVYEGLADESITEIERIALDRSYVMQQEA